MTLKLQVFKNANLFDSNKTNGSSFDMFLHFSECVLFGGQALAVDHRNQGGAIVVHCGRPLVLTGAFGPHSGRPCFR